MKKIEYQTYKKPSDFIRFEQGDTSIRIISSGAMVKKHGMRTAKGFVPLGDCTEEPDCKYCLQGNDPKLKWMWIAVVRPDNEVKLLDVGPMVGDAICKIAQEKGKDPKDYDLIITKTGDGLRAKYTVKAAAVSLLTPKDEAAFKAAKLRLIKKYFTSQEKPLYQQPPEMERASA